MLGGLTWPVRALPRLGGVILLALFAVVVAMRSFMGQQAIPAMGGLSAQVNAGLTFGCLGCALLRYPGAAIPITN
jgi:hypothetical protein